MRAITVTALGLIATAAPAVAQDPFPRTLIRPPVLAPRLAHSEKCVSPSDTVSFTARGLPADRGSLRSVVETTGGIVPLTIVQWSASRIDASVPSDRRLVSGANYPVGIQDAAGAWVVRADQSLLICLTAPAGSLAARLPPRGVVPLGVTPKPKDPNAPPPSEAPAEPSGKPEEPAGRPLAEDVTEPAGTPLAGGPPLEPPCPARLPTPPANAVTCPLVMVGAGISIAERGPFVPVRARTEALTMMSVGVSAPTRPPFAPIRLRTEPLILIGISEP